MKFPLKASIAALALIVATPALAATVVVDGQVYNEGDTITIDFTGMSDDLNGPGNVDPGLTASLDLTFDGIDGNNYLFSYDLDNTSSDPIEDSIVTVLGFSTDGTVVLNDSDVDGTFDSIGSGNMTQGFNVQICFSGSDDGNCTSGDPQEGAFQDGANATGDIILAFDSLEDSITLSNFAVRYQGIVSGNVNDGSGVGGGNPPPPIPEPATWAMMLMGFGATGYAIRRRRKPVLAQLA